MAQGRKETYQRVKYSPEQVQMLEDAFKKSPFVSPELKMWLAEKLGVTERQILTWFQNKRATLRRLAIRKARGRYVPKLMCPPASLLERLERNSPRRAENTAQGAPRALGAHSTGAVGNGILAQVQLNHGHVASGSYPWGSDSLALNLSHGIPARLHSASTNGPEERVQLNQGHLAAGSSSSVAGSLYLPQQDGKLSPSASTPSPADAWSEENPLFSLSPEAESQSVDAASPAPQTGDSAWPSLPGAPPSLSTTPSFSNQFFLTNDRSSGAVLDCSIQGQQRSYDAATAAGPWQEHPRWQHTQASRQLHVAGVHQRPETAPAVTDESEVVPTTSCQTNGATAASPDEEVQVVPEFKIAASYLRGIEEAF